jgi:hypothetical protein
MTEEITVAFAWWTLLVLIVTVVYIAMLVQLFRHRKQVPFKYTFFQISFQLGIADVLMIIYIFLWYRLPKFHMFPCNLIHQMSDGAKVIFVGIQSVFIVYFLHVEIIGVILLSINRYTSLCLPLRHKTVGLIFSFNFKIFV